VQGPGRPLLCLVHITDLQLADVQSPTRFEFLNAHFADRRYAQIIPVQRPQEALTAHAVDATIRTLGAVHGPVTGLPMQLAVTTGDAIDNAQWNELQAFLALFDGGLVSPDSGGPDYEGVQAPELLDHDEYLSIMTTMVDHDTPVAPSLPLETSDDLAALHRELAANVPWDVTVMAGTAADRNVELRVVPPFPLKRLPGV
jgi:hypothetical protein